MLKVYIFGATGVGRKTFIRALKLSNSDQNTDDTNSCIIELSDQRSTKGVIQFHFQISSNHNEKCHAAIYMYHDYKSFQWVQNSIQQCATSIKFLIANKSDLASQEVEIDEAQDFAMTHGMMFVKISAKLGQKIQMLLRMLRVKLSQDPAEPNNFDQTLSQLNKQMLGDTLEISRQSLLKNLREATINDNMEVNRKEYSDTPQFDQFQRRKNNFAMLDELKDAIQSYSDDQDEEQTPKKIISPRPQLIYKPQTQQTSSDDFQPFIANQSQAAASKGRDEETFLRKIDDEIKRTEVSIKQMNDRYLKMRSQSPINFATNQEMNNSKSTSSVPVYHATLFKKVQEIPKTVNQPQTSFPREKPLMTLKVDLGEKFGTHNVYLLKDDISSSQVAERLLIQARAKQILSREEYRRIVHRLSAHLEHVINSQINQMVTDRNNQLAALEKQKQELQQLEREKRIMQAQTCDTNLMRSAQRSQRNERKILGSLSVVMGPGKKGQIVMREGDDINTIVKSFIQLYGLKKEVHSTICESLRQLIYAENQQV